MRRLVLLIFLIMALLMNCAYYNTFFNAKKEFGEAEEAYKENPPEMGLNSNQKLLYEQAIKKASKVIVFHPNSKYVDDALFLMGKAYFRMEEFGKAQRKFDELLANYPQSDFRQEAGYLLGTVHYYMDDKIKARDALIAVIEDPKKNPWADDARLILGEMAYWAEDYQGAVLEYARIAEDYPKSELRSEALYMTGECSFILEDYSQALDAYTQASRFDLKGKRRYQVDLRIGECYQKLNQYPQALETFEDLAGSDLYVDYLPEIRLQIAEVNYSMGDTTRALEEYENIIQKNPKTEEAAGAYYHLGLIHMANLDNLSVAKDYFDKSKAEAPASEAGSKASLKRSQINRLEEYRGKVAQADSLPNPEAIFTLAEIYLLDLDRPDSALVHYQRVVEKTPLSKYAPPSAYVAAWIVENSLQDTARGETMYRELITSYPATESADAARKRLGLPSVSDTTHRDAARRLLQAEELLLKQDDVDGALVLYHSVVAEFPTSPYVPKAECAIAWTLEHVKGDLDSALALYKALVQKYPDSECAALAQKKSAPPPSPVPVMVDTSRQVSADTTVAEQVPDEPTEVERGDPEDEEEDQRNERQSRRQRPGEEQPQEEQDPEDPTEEP